MPAAHALDISRRRHGGNAQSNEAFGLHSARFTADRESIWHYLRKYPHGLTAKEIAWHFNVPLHSVSGRISELKLAGRVLRTTERRDGCAVVVAMSPSSELLANVPARTEVR